MTQAYWKSPHLLPLESYEHYTMLPTTGEIKREREQPRVLVYIQMAKEHNKQLRLGI